MLFPLLPLPKVTGPVRIRPVSGLGLAAVLLLILSKQTHILNRPYAWLYDGIYVPVRTVVQFPLRRTEYEIQAWQKKQDTAALLLSLQQENEELRAQVQLLGHFQAENRRLRMLMDSVLNVTDPVLIAELNDTAIDGYHEFVTINKGKADGVYLNQAVIDPYGLVGQVVEVFAHEARVMLITDARSKIPVYVERTQQRALVTGSNGYGTLAMPTLRADSDIRTGDRLMSSGLGGVYPRGYPVAEITGVTHDRGASFVSVKLKPLAHLQSMLEVLLLDRRKSVLPVSTVVPVGPPEPTAGNSAEHSAYE